MVVSFIGHRDIEDRGGVYKKIRAVMHELIVYRAAEVFLFGSRSDFDSLCVKAAKELKSEFPQIKRIYIRAECPVISDSYREYRLEDYDDTFFPESLQGAGKAVYVERNKLMIDSADVCVFYCDMHAATETVSGTRLAFRYALSKQKQVINLFDTRSINSVM